MGHWSQTTLSLGSAGMWNWIDRMWGTPTKLCPKMHESGYVDSRLEWLGGLVVLNPRKFDNKSIEFDGIIKRSKPGTLAMTELLDVQKVGPPESWGQRRSTGVYDNQLVPQGGIDLTATQMRLWIDGNTQTTLEQSTNQDLTKLNVAWLQWSYENWSAFFKHPGHKLSSS